MIGKIARIYCCEDLSLIENYDKAINDNTQIWDCHHRLEIQDNRRLYAHELKELGLLYNRPASELIFLTKSEHSKLHAKNIHDETREKRRINQTGKNNTFYGKKHSEESKKKMSKLDSEETKMKKSEAHKGLKREYNDDGTWHWVRVKNDTSVSLF